MKKYFRPFAEISEFEAEELIMASSSGGMEIDNDNSEEGWGPLQ